MIDTRKLREGDRVRNLGSGEAYTIIQGARPGRDATAVRAIEVSNPGEWAIVSRSEEPLPAPTRRRS